MVFSSLIFLFVFLPVFLALYYPTFLLGQLLFTNTKFFVHASNFLILIASLLFYFWGAGWLTALMIITAVVDYFFALVMSRWFLTGKITRLKRGGQRTFGQRAALVASLVSNLGMLGFFKYFNFGVETANQLASVFSLSPMDAQFFGEIVLPIGISFYTFHTLSYTIDVYRGEIPATLNIVDFACYVTMFPQLVAGPIVRYRDVATQLTDRTISIPQSAWGIERFVFGLAKKVLIANTMAVVADRVFSLPVDEVSIGLAWIGVAAYTLQIYFDFSGYSDMAIGLAHMLGFRLHENFNYPYIARNVQEFWRRWHISLSTWFRDYLYIPLGGSRRGPFWTYRNLFVVFLLCGLWHGAQMTFVVWGLYHGFFLVAERVGLDRILARFHWSIQHAYTLLVVMFGWVLFRSESMPYALGYLRAMVDPIQSAGVTSSVSVADCLTPEALLAFCVGVVFSAPIYPMLRAVFERMGERFPVAVAGIRFAGINGLFLAAAASLMAGTHNPFIYYQF